LTELQDILEDFGSVTALQPVVHETSEPSFNEAELEGQKLEAFEKGYRAGWDDALKAQVDEKEQISSALGQHLQDLSFTYHEAYGHVMAAVTPLLQDIVASVLPEIARSTLGHHISQQLENLSGEIGQAEVEIAVAPGMLTQVEGVIGPSQSFPLKVVSDDTLEDQQADIRFGQHERQIDLSDLIASVTEAVEGFAHDNQRKLSHG